MEFFPSSDPGNLIIAAGDNDGHLGIWDLNKVRLYFTLDDSRQTHAAVSSLFDAKGPLRSDPQ